MDASPEGGPWSASTVGKADNPCPLRRCVYALQRKSYWIDRPRAIPVEVYTRVSLMSKACISWLSGHWNALEWRHWPINSRLGNVERWCWRWWCAAADAVLCQQPALFNREQWETERPRTREWERHINICVFVCVSFFIGARPRILRSGDCATIILNCLPIRKWYWSLIP